MSRAVLVKNIQCNINICMIRHIESLDFYAPKGTLGGVVSSYN